ncbi:MAG TPA: histidine phosphatase family protein [Acidimicrobiales bacterium]|nr:histidine phosphatase family protein [Acidimicrobiales bacterium]
MALIWVLRHAKAVAHNKDDHGRALTGRGRRQCAEVGKWLRSGDCPEPLPGLVWSSSAIRARETAALALADVLGSSPGVAGHVEVEQWLYQAHPDNVVDRLRLLGAEVASVMVVGHNPTMAELAMGLLGPADPVGRAIMEQGMATGAVAVVEVTPGPWSGLSMGEGTLRALHVPTAR